MWAQGLFERDLLRLEAGTHVRQLARELGNGQHHDGGQRKIEEFLACRVVERLVFGAPVHHAAHQRHRVEAGNAHRRRTQAEHAEHHHQRQHDHGRPVHRSRDHVRGPDQRLRQDGLRHGQRRIGEAAVQAATNEPVEAANEEEVQDSQHADLPRVGHADAGGVDQQQDDGSGDQARQAQQRQRPPLPAVVAEEEIGQACDPPERWRRVERRRSDLLRGHCLWSFVFSAE
jgi:hypothetical protein